MNTPEKKNILVVEDVLSQAETYAGFLRIAGYTPHIATTGADAFSILDRENIDAIVLDLHLPDMDGDEILIKTHQQNACIPIIIVTADTSTEAAMAALKNGAYDFILKPFPASRLIVTLHHALQHDLLSREVSEWRIALGQVRYHSFVGQSAPMQAIYRIIESVAASKASVFITGESGTGKELAARALHDASGRREQAFVALNCGAIPHNLLESQLFGHIRGAFTGAVSDAPGAARKAHKGTLFLDEICEMPLDLQVKVLRFLQTGEIESVGSTKTEKLDIRIVAATNKNPLEEIKAGHFREDLYYRLHVVPLEMPPLRERDDDVLLLTSEFLQKFNLLEAKDFSGCTEDVLRAFRRYEWPGNVRQLENMIHQIVVMHQGKLIDQKMMPPEIQALMETSEAATAVPLPLMPSSSVQPLWRVEKDAILRALNFTQQDVVKAAVLLEVSPSTLYRKLQTWKKEN